MRIVGLLLLFGLIVSTLSASFVAASGADPSYQNGFARHAAESARPQDWVGLVGFWLPTLGPTGVTLRDWAGHGNDGTLTNMAPGSDWVLDSEQGYVLDLDGSDDYIAVADTPVIGLDDIDRATFMVWMFARSLGQNDQGRIFDKGGGSSISSGYTFNITSSDRIQLQVNSVVGDFTAVSNDNAFILDAWHQVVAVYDGVAGNVDFYVNGEPVGSEAIEGSTSIAANTEELRIGIRATDLNRDFDGFLTNLRIYNIGLTPRHIQEIYQDSLGIVRLVDDQAFHSIQAAAATPQVIIIGWAVPEWLAIIITNLGLARIGG